MIYELNDDPYAFPDPHDGEEDGLLAVGGDLSLDRLLTAYSKGIFPWYDFKNGEDILWWCPLKRFVIFPGEIHISHSMRQLINKDIYSVTFNAAFDDVIHNCSVNQGRCGQEGAWLGSDMIAAYTELHKYGWAASVEVWDKDNRLVGGLYGVSIGRNFFGESMFSLVPSASKLALIALAMRLEPHHGFIDCQLETPHLKSMGGRYITYEEYMTYINE